MIVICTQFRDFGPKVLCSWTALHFYIFIEQWKAPFLLQSIAISTSQNFGEHGKHLVKKHFCLLTLQVSFSLSISNYKNRMANTVVSAVRFRERGDPWRS